MVEFREETDSILKFYCQHSSLSYKVVIIILLTLKDSFMKHSLKLKSCVFTFRSFMVIAVSLWVVIPLKGFAQAKKSELTREVDFSSQVKMVPQKCHYWCYYACLEAVTDNLQCFYCSDYIRHYLMNEESNPYPQNIVSNEDFENAIEMFKENYDAPCESSSVYDNFGISAGNFYTYLETNGFGICSSSDFVRKISQEGENPTITFFVKREDETAHCVAFVGSKLYNNNWNDPNSVIYIMDPGYSDIKSYTLSELYTYNAIYCK